MSAFNWRRLDPGHHIICSIPESPEPVISGGCMGISQFDRNAAQIEMSVVFTSNYGAGYTPHVRVFGQSYWGNRTETEAEAVAWCESIVGEVVVRTLTALSELAISAGVELPMNNAVKKPENTGIVKWSQMTILI